MADDQLRAFRDRFKVPVDDKELAKAPYVELDSGQQDYILKRRGALGGAFPERKAADAPKLEMPTSRSSTRCSGTPASARSRRHASCGR